ncbi:MAG TPA: trigger factor [Vicinamibacterales bacterium]|nr:trigger factor [Vicinamibacterales bacterium]
MKTEFIDVSDTQKNLVVEIDSTVVDAEIDKIARDYGKAARIPGFRPGKVPSKVVRQRFRDQILHDVVHGLIPRAVDEALRDRGIEPVDTPDIKDVVVEEGQPLKFTASFETVPPIDPGDYSTITLKNPTTTVDDAAVDEALKGLRERSARYESVEDRAVEMGDSVQLDLERTAVGENGEAQTDRHDAVTVDLGASANPPGFDEALTGMNVGERKSFDVNYPEDYPIAELAGSTVKYDATVKAIRKRVLPELDDEFAKDLGDFESLEALKTRIRADLEHQMMHENEREIRGELVRQIAERVTIDVPPTLLNREIERRTEDFVRRLIEQKVDPMKVNINWEEFREKQREAAIEAVKSALLLDEVSRRENIAASDADVDEEIARYAERTNRTPAAVRARLEKDGGLGAVYAGIRRERTVDFLLSRAARI